MHSYRTDKKLKNHERICSKRDYFNLRMPPENKKILKYNSGEKSLKASHIFYIHLESLLVKIQSRQNNPEKSYTEKKSIHVSCGYSLDLITSYDLNKNKHSFYRGTDYTKKLCEDLKDLAMEVITYEKKEMIPLADIEKWKYETQKYCHICKRKFSCDQGDKSKYKVYHKVRDHCHYTGKFRGATHNICNLRYKLEREI